MPAVSLENLKKKRRLCPISLGYHIGGALVVTFINIFLPQYDSVAEEQLSVECKIVFRNTLMFLNSLYYRQALCSVPYQHLLACSHKSKVRVEK